MSLFLEALGHAEDDKRASTSPARTILPSGLALEPLAGESPPPHVPAGDAPATPPGTLPEPRHLTQPASPYPRGTLLLGSAGAAALAGLATGIWLELQPLAHAEAPPPRRQASAAPPAALEGANPPARPATPPNATTDANPGRHLSVAAKPAARHQATNRPAPPDHPSPDHDGTAAHIHQRNAAGNTPLTSAAHTAYMAGDLPRATALYRAALQATPTDTDALRGLGALALQDHRPHEAEAHFNAALRLDPADSVAISGLSLIRPDITTQARLRHHLAEQPEALAPHLALAERLASELRWTEARRSYTAAHRLAPNDPDIAYNLAVSLDQTGQLRKAEEHYRIALSLATQQPVHFDPTRCAARLHALTAIKTAP